MVSGITTGNSATGIGNELSAEKKTTDGSTPSTQPQSRAAAEQIKTTGSTSHSDFSSGPPGQAAASAAAQDPVYAIAAQSPLAKRLTSTDASMEDVLKLLRFAFNGSALECDQSLLAEYKELRTRMNKSSGNVMKGATEAKKFLFDCLYARLNEGPVKERLKVAVADAEKPLREESNYDGYVKATRKMLEALLHDPDTASLLANQRWQCKPLRYVQIGNVKLLLENEPEDFNMPPKNYQHGDAFKTKKVIEEPIEELTAQMAEKDTAIEKFAGSVSAAVVAHGIASVAPLSEEHAGEIRQALADMLLVRENDSPNEIKGAVVQFLTHCELKHPGIRAAAEEQVKMVLDIYALTESGNEAVKAGLTQFLNSPPTTRPA